MLRSNSTLLLTYNVLLFMVFRCSSTQQLASDNFPWPRIMILEGSQTLNSGRLSRTLIGCQGNNKDCLRPGCPFSGTCSQEIRFGVGKWLGNGIETTVINIQGNVLDADINNILSKTIGSVSLVLLDLKQENIDHSLLKNIRKLSSFLKFWDHVALQFSNWSAGESSDIHQTDKQISKAKTIETYQKVLQDEFGMSTRLPSVFIDVNDSRATNSTSETSKLLNILASGSRLQLVTIDDILEDLHTFKSSTQTLQSSMRSDIINLKEENLKLKAEVLEARHSILENDQEIQSIQMDSRQNKDKLNEKSLELKKSDQSINASLLKIIQDKYDDHQAFLLRHENSLRAHENSLAQYKSTTNKWLGRMVPVGTIIAWSGQNISNIPIPEGWQSCDNSLITAGPMKLKRTPNLNGEERFLRGGSVSINWNYQEQMLEEHNHHIDDPGHNHEDAGHRHSLARQYSSGEYYDSDYCLSNEWCSTSSTRSVYTSYADILNSKSGISVTKVLSAQTGHETRPKNMVVQYIIKIY